MRVASSIDASLVAKENLLVLNYKGESVIVRTPTLYEDLVVEARDTFSLPHDSNLVFETAHLNICCGQPARLSKSMWKILAPIVGNVTVRMESCDEDDIAPNNSSNLLTPRNSSSPAANRSPPKGARQRPTNISSESTKRGSGSQKQHIHRRMEAERSVISDKFNFGSIQRRVPQTPSAKYDGYNEDARTDSPELESEEDLVCDYAVPTKTGDSEDEDVEEEDNENDVSQDEDDGGTAIAEGISGKNGPEDSRPLTRARLRALSEENSGFARRGKRSNFKTGPGASRGRTTSKSNQASDATGLRRGRSVSRASSAKSIVSVNRDVYRKRHERFVVKPLPLSARAILRAERYKEGQHFTIQVSYPTAAATPTTSSDGRRSLDQSYGVGPKLQVEKLLMKACGRFGLETERARIFKVVVDDKEVEGEEELVECRLDQTLADLDVWDGDRFVLKVDGEGEEVQEGEKEEEEEEDEDEEDEEE